MSPDIGPFWGWIAALLRAIVLQPILDPAFSDHSYGFRPGRSAHGAVLAAQSYVQSGRLRSYILGWKAYFRLAQTPRVFRELEQWMRHRLRAIQLKQWKRGKTIYRELTALGAPVDVARRVAAGSRHWWRNNGKLINTVLTLKWSDRLGVPRLS